MTTDLTRLIVNLTPRAVSALEQAAHRTGLSRTDVVNISVQLYNQLAEAGERQGIIHLEAPDITGAPLYLMTWRQPFVRATRRWWRPWS